VRDIVLGLGAHVFVDLQAEPLESVGEVDLALDVLGGQVLERTTRQVRAGGTVVSIAAQPSALPERGRAVFFVVEPDRIRLADLIQRVRDGRLAPIVGAVQPLEEAASAFAPQHRVHGKTIIRVAEG
jgi:NADPH:quinone reductase-like Zn-dependent oxidoreductase